MEYTNLSVFDYGGKKICDLYDSNVKTPGQAHNIELTRELSGWKELSFDLPYLIDTEKNWRWKCIRNEYRIRVTVGEKEDWFIITAPKKSKASNRINGSVTCGHLSGVLKTKNLYLSFDDTNGIGTLPYLMKQILAGTGWAFDEEGSDIFYETHATDDDEEQVEKKRSITSDGKAGAYSLIGTVCDLFNAYPIFDAVHKTVSCHDKNNKRPLVELEIGYNLTTLSKEPNSESTVTRLYVEGDYDDDEYVGIDDVNPTGLPYLMNFDYYKEIGVFTDAHQKSLDEYIENISAIRQETMVNAKELAEKSSVLALLWGTVNYVLWTVKDGALEERFIGGEVEEDRQAFEVGDLIYIFTNDGKYTMHTVTVDTRFDFRDTVTHVLKFIGKCNGSIGAKEVAIEAKEQTIAELEEANRKETTSDEVRARNIETINSIRATIASIYEGTEEAETHDYKIKITGTKELHGGDQIDAQIARTSTSLILNTAAYKLASDTVPIQSDETVSILADDVKLRLGDYGITGILPEHATASAIEGAVNDLYSEILNISSVERTIPMTCVSASSGVAVKLFGTTFTMTVSAIAYGLYEQFTKAVTIATEVGRMMKIKDQQLIEQQNIEADFVIAMGDMLRDGYWNNKNYIRGQEKYLYYDALDVMKEVSKPKVKYTVALTTFSKAIGYIPSHVELNASARIYDEELEINDIVYVSKIREYLDREDQGDVEITNEEISISSSFDSIFSRITSIADLIEQKQTIFKRAEAIQKDGTLATDRLNGAIDLLTTRLSSAVSNWYTDERGNIIFEASDGKSAMQLCGAGFMIANGKKKDGSWNWRTAGTGEGLVADAIVTGYLSAERIEAGSITANKLSSDVGSKLDLSSNESIKLTVQDAIDSTTTYQLKIISDNGLFFSNDISEITLSAKVFANGEDKTKNYEASAFSWFRTSGDAQADEVWNSKHTGTNSVTILSSDMESSATYECRITIQISEDVSRVYFDTASVANLNDDAFLFYLSSNMPSIQIYDPNMNGGYSPDWGYNPLVVEPYVFINGSRTTPSVNSALQIEWLKMVNGSGENMTLNEFPDSNGILHVTDNILSQVNSRNVTYVCTVIYNGREIGKESIGFTQSKSPEKAKSCILSGGNVFKYTNGIVNPNTQMITCEVTNVSIVEWQYLRSNGSYAKIPGSGTENTLVIEATDPNGLFNGDVCTVKVITSDSTVYDIFSIYKVSNGATGDPGSSYYAYIRYSAYSDGRQMQVSPTADTKYIGSYAGPSSTVPPYTAFKWSRYVGSDITVESTVVEYNQVSSEVAGKPDDDDAGWGSSVPQLIEGYFLWTRTTVIFSDKSVMKTYSVSYNGKTGATGTSYYTYVRYSANADGSNMTRLPESDTAYIGIYTGTATSAPTAYSAYTWSRLKGDQGSGVTILSTSTKYAKTDTNMRPDESSDVWADEIPQITEGCYLWSKTVVCYSDDTSVTTYNVSYSGTDGENTAHAFLTNECISFAADDSGKVGYSKVTTTVCAYLGTTKVQPVIDFTNITDIPDGMTVTSGNVTGDGEVQIHLTVSEGAYLGSTGLRSGQIGIPVSVSKDGVICLQTTLYLSWIKLKKGKDGENGIDGVVFSLYTPDGNTFLQGQGNLTVKAFARSGEKDLTLDSTATFAWSYYEGGRWNAFDGETGSSIVVSGSDVNAMMNIRCVMSYHGTQYTAVATLTDKTDVYQATISSSAGDTFINVGTTSLTCLLYKNGKKENAGEHTFAWSELDKDGKVTSYTATGATITVSSSDIDEKATFICEVEGIQAQFTITVRTDIYVSDAEPESPVPDMIWLDTSGDISVLKRWIAAYIDPNSGETIEAHWAECTINQSTIEALQNFRKTTSTELAALKSSVEARVTTEQYNADMKTMETKIGELALTDDKFQVMFNRTVSSGINDQISSVAGDLSSYKGSVSNYMQFGSDGVLTLGSSKSSFKTQITNQKVAFLEGTSEVAYISNRSMFITNARVTEQLSIGTDNGEGYFDWTVTPTGLGLKWRDPSDKQ